MSDIFGDLPRNHFGVLYADPPWQFDAWSEFKPLASGGVTRAIERHYQTVDAPVLAKLPVAELAAPDCALFMWVCWPTLRDAWELLDAWGFAYKTCAFSWVKANVRQLRLFEDDATADMGLGYWTRANSEVCLLATRGKPKRLNADVRQGIIEPRRGHSRKPDCVYGRIERLVSGPYLELFARNTRPGWTSWGNETGKNQPVTADIRAPLL